MLSNNMKIGGVVAAVLTWGLTACSSASSQETTGVSGEAVLTDFARCGNARLDTFDRACTVTERRVTVVQAGDNPNAFLPYLAGDTFTSIHLWNVNGMNEGYVRFDPPPNAQGEWAFYLGTPNVPLTITNASSSEQTICTRYVSDTLANELIGRDCRLKGAYVADLHGGPFLLHFGPIDPSVEVITLVAERRHESDFVGVGSRECSNAELGALTTACSVADATTPIRAGDFGTVDAPDLALDTAYGVHLQPLAGAYEGSVEFVPPYTDDYLVSLGTPFIPTRVTSGGEDASVTCGHWLSTETKASVTGGACESIRSAFRVHLTGGQKARLELGREPAEKDHQWVRVVVSATHIDSDGDGVADPYDVCPNDPTATVDEDGDGVCGAADACPLDPENDADADGLCGNVDNCPNVANTNQANQDGDALGDACDACPTQPGADVDADGVCDAVDNCPLTANADQSDEDGDGRGDVCDGTVGYYDMLVGAGNSTQVASIVTGGGTPQLVTELSPATLGSLSVLVAQNPDNDRFGLEYTSALSDIAAAVQNGLVLVIHDRYVDNAQRYLPGGESFSILRNFADDRNIQVLDASTLVTNGPGGLIDNDSLDNGTSSSHGFAVLGTLPATSRNILSRTGASEIVTFCYPHGIGAVIYSSIPLDYYLAEHSLNEPLKANMRAYAANVVAWALAGACHQ
ncbi:MAG: thrombospondin type 3 repeat-containing protein [Myxococcota bacterium]